jgi:two-component system response regulator RegX3
MDVIDILIIEDNKEISRLLGDFLKKEGYHIHQSYNGEDGIKFIDENKVRLVILDIMLPRMDGFAVCKKIRKENNIPIIILSAKTAKDDKLMCMELGADDYMEKPYDIDLLLAKVKAIYRRNYSEDFKGHILMCSDIKVDCKLRQVWKKDKLLSLTVKEYELLLLFMENEGKALNKDWIFNQVWGRDSFSESSTLTVHVKWLREKIEEEPKVPKLIQTIWGVGYRFIIE